MYLKLCNPGFLWLGVGEQLFSFPHPNLELINLFSGKTYFGTKAWLARKKNQPKKPQKKLGKTFTLKNHLIKFHFKYFKAFL